MEFHCDIHSFKCFGEHGICCLCGAIYVIEDGKLRPRTKQEEVEDDFYALLVTQATGLN